MSSRARTAVVAALALATFGLAGPAGLAHAAASLTKSEVKSIAKGVVKKQAKKITVKNATQLGGHPPAAYQDNVIVWTISVDSGLVLRRFPLSLPAGSYLISYSAYMFGAGAGGAGCYLQHTEGNSNRYVGSDYINYDTNAVSGSGYVNVTQGELVELTCSASAPWTTTVNEPIQVVATPLDTVTAQTVAIP